MQPDRRLHARKTDTGFQPVIMVSSIGRLLPVIRRVSYGAFPVIMPGIDGAGTTWMEYYQYVTTKTASMLEKLQEKQNTTILYVPHPDHGACRGPMFRTATSNAYATS
ncbi:hypothetical protein SXCC_01462 [Gluconacetobacter sp. SXCC-1]|nr:hypothetical protein SXCC_01462 [Gluconacetobacter sp. SXCC-1]